MFLFVSGCIVVEMAGFLVLDIVLSTGEFLTLLHKSAHVEIT